mmetsp:Transcript_26084/g.44515  ORF Transcript_26084/g.44515 Transcript_26084/m.44515 type:complete len:286 (+) Transcript_26084:1278-2135(+)
MHNVPNQVHEPKHVFLQDLGSVGELADVAEREHGVHLPPRDERLHSGPFAQTQVALDDLRPRRPVAHVQQLGHLLHRLFEKARLKQLCVVVIVGAVAVVQQSLVRRLVLFLVRVFQRVQTDGHDVHHLEHAFDGGYHQSPAEGDEEPGPEAQQEDHEQDQVDAELPLLFVVVPIVEHRQRAFVVFIHVASRLVDRVGRVNLVVGGVGADFLQFRRLFLHQHSPAHGQVEQAVEVAVDPAVHPRSVVVGHERIQVPVLHVFHRRQSHLHRKSDVPLRVQKRCDEEH